MEKKISTAKKIIYGIVITATTVTAVAVPTAIKITHDRNNQETENKKDNFGALPDKEPEVERGTLVSDLIIPAPEREGLEFKGWYKDPECTMPFADDEYVYSTTKVYAKWELAKYGISFNLPQGMSIQVLKVDGTEYTQEELSAIPHGTTLNFRVNSDDHIKGTNYLYTLTNNDEALESTYTNNEHIYSLTVEDSTQISLENRFEYTATAQNSDGNNCVTITNYRNYCEADEITVPETIANMPVSFIFNLSGGDLSDENTTVKTVNLSKYIENFDAEYMGLISNLERINIDAENQYLSSVQGVVLQNTDTVIFAPRGTVIKNLELPTTVTTIGNNAFENCLYIKLINFEKLTHLTTIGTKAFANSGIVSAKLPSSISYLGYSAFNSCMHLNEIVIDTANEITFGSLYNVCVTDAIFYSRMGTTSDRIQYERCYVTYTFANCPNIKHVYWNTPVDIFSYSTEGNISKGLIFANSTVDKFEFNNSRDEKNILSFNNLLGIASPNHHSAYLSIGSAVKVSELIINGKCDIHTGGGSLLFIETITLQGTSLETIYYENTDSSKYIYINEADAETYNLTLNDDTFSYYKQIATDRLGYAKFEYKN